MPPGLLYNVSRDARRWGLHHEADVGACGRCRTVANAKLQALLKTKADEAVKTWKARVKTLPGACKWAKAKAPPPWVISFTERRMGEDHCQVAAGQAAGAALLRKAWKPVFCGPEGYCPDHYTYFQCYEDFLAPQSEQWDLPELSGSDLKRTVAAMGHKAGGVDGWDASSLLPLPKPAWDRLCSLFQEVENSGVWPRALHHWKLVFLPKTQKGMGVLDALDTRPIAIGPLLYRAYGRLRWQQLGRNLVSSLHHFQVGGNASHDAESLICAIMGEAHEKQYGVSLDFKKAFDSVDWSLSAALLRRAGVPWKVMNAIEGMWQNHVRWCTFGQQVHEEPITKVWGLPQGDPWSPAALAVVLAGPVRKIASTTNIFQVTYLDDRTAFCDSAREVGTFLREWTLFESTGRLRTNQAKTQFLGRNMAARLDLARRGWQAHSTMEVLGTVIGPQDRPDTPKERKRIQEVQEIAARVSILPVSLSSKSTLIATLLAPKAVWGWTVNGRPPTAGVRGDFLGCCKQVWRGQGFSHLHAAVPLLQAFGLGHASDLLFLSTCRMIQAAARWMQARETQGARVQFPEALQRPVAQALAQWGWSFEPDGRVVGPPGTQSFDPRQPHRVRMRALHDIRTSWRHHLVSKWFEMPRNDGLAAREDGELPSRGQVNMLHQVAKKADGWSLSVMVGAMASPAVDFRLPRGERVQVCWHCNQQQVPTTTHVLWECPSFAEVRRLQRPQSALAARLGWSPGMTSEEVTGLLTQLGEIRRREVAARGRMQGWIRSVRFDSPPSEG